MIVRILGLGALAIFLFQLPAAEAKTKPKPHYVTAKIIGSKELKASSGGQMSTNTSRSSECLTPQHGGSLVLGSGNVTEVNASGDFLYDGKPLPGRPPEVGDPSSKYNIGWWVRENSKQQICIEIFARTSAKEINVFYNAKAVATESYRK
ncbi:hypothetical protein CO670_23820 [Rhizobium sp. J15]|uniref:hypothetical protein n=1 Tax=Rhizobium sp. J15 TaxID=2035450 RepID=UPI000BE797AB|nr:hypothetical protein [Rhizobium sp. J15]PDT14318.1 hypothetical protein CO670_23820 [Rhizobium sp. J15]